MISKTYSQSVKNKVYIELQTKNYKKSTKLKGKIKHKKEERKKLPNLLP